MVRPRSNFCRQGDSLLWYLFLLCAEGFRAIIHRRYKLCMGSEHLFIVRWSLIYFLRMIVWFSWMLRCMIANNLSRFFMRLNLVWVKKLTLKKTVIYFSLNMHSKRKTEISQLLNIHVVTCHAWLLFRPTNSIRHTKIETFEMIKERVRNKLCRWKENFFSAGGKEILIKAVAQCIPNYFMGCFRLPHGLCIDLNAKISRSGGVRLKMVRKFIRFSRGPRVLGFRKFQ